MPVADNDNALFEEFANEFERFWREREKDGLVKIFHDYGKWLLRKRWYAGPLRQKREVQ